MRALVVIVALGACSFEHGLATGGDDVGDDAAVTADAETDAAVPLGAWDTPVVITLAGTGADDDASMTNDRLELYINRGGDVYFAQRATTNDPWSIPGIDTGVSSNAGETTPEISYDGLSIVVASDRAGTQDLYFATRTARDEAWSTLDPITAANSSSSEAGGNITPDGLALVFSSTKVNGSPDLFLVERTSTSDPFGTPVELTAINTTGHEGSPFLSPDKKTIYFDSDRSGTTDIWMSQRASTNDAFPAPQVITEIATTFAEEDPWLSSDGRRLVFTSNRGGSSQLWEATR